MDGVGVNRIDRYQLLTHTRAALCTTVGRCNGVNIMASAVLLGLPWPDVQPRDQLDLVVGSLSHSACGAAARNGCINKLVS